MADHSKIEWTDATWNPITGCSVVSPGCTNCYAMRLAGTRLKNHPSRAGLTRDTKAGPVWTGEVRFNGEWLDQPLRWTKPRMIFVCAHGDLFAEGVPDEWIDRVFAVMALCPQHIFQVLTKRPERMRDYLTAKVRPFWRIHLDAAADPSGLAWIRDDARAITPYNLYLECPLPLPNVWLGVSAEDQRRADERIPILLDTPAAIRWISAEPLLGPIEFAPWIDRLDWIVAGGESGPGARPMHPDWVRSIRDQCAAAGAPFLFKQWGSWGRAMPRPSGTPGRFAIAGARPHSDFWPATVIEANSYPRQIALFSGATVLENIGKKAAGRLLDGVEHNGFPTPYSLLPTRSSAEPTP